MSEDKRYAIKVMEKEHIKRKNMLDEILSERSIMAQIDCKYIVKLFYCLQVKFFLWYLVKYRKAAYHILIYMHLVNEFDLLCDGVLYRW